jgi:Primase C terminal 2 (PriCT-2)
LRWATNRRLRNPSREQRPYGWYGGEPGDVRGEDLPYACRDDIVGFLTDAEKLLSEEFKFEKATRPSEDKQKKRTSGAWIPRDDDDERLASALAFIPADDRETRIKIGLALHSHLGEVGWSLWDRWLNTSSNCDGKNRERAWRSFGRSKRSERVGAGTIFHYAEQHGWEAPPLPEAERKPWSAAGYFIKRCAPRRAWRIFKSWCQTDAVPPIAEEHAWQIFRTVIEKDLSK